MSPTAGSVFSVRDGSEAIRDGDERGDDLRVEVAARAGDDAS